MTVVRGGTGRMDQAASRRAHEMIAEIRYLDLLVRRGAGVQFGPLFWAIGLAGIGAGAVWLSTEGALAYQLCWLLGATVGCIVSMRLYAARLRREGTGLGRQTLIRLIAGGGSFAMSLAALPVQQLHLSAPWCAAAGACLYAARRWPRPSLFVGAAGTMLVVGIAAALDAGSGYTDLGVGALMCACALLDRRHRRPAGPAVHTYGHAHRLRP